METIEEPENLGEANSNDSDHEDDLLAWRRDPKESFSDWKIEVIQQSDEKRSAYFGEHPSNDIIETVKGSSTVYHVHRLFLASGNRKCEYFKTLFASQDSSFVEQSSHTTKLELPESACEAFPAFLDFLYGGRQHLKFNERTAVALHYLADYLQCDPLRAYSDDCIQMNLDASNVHVYCREGLLYGVEWVVEACIQVAAFFPQELLPMEAVSPTPSMELLSPSSTSSSLGSSSPLSGAAAGDDGLTPRVRDVMAMLPPTQQVKLLQLSLTKSLDELKQFKRVPSQWKENIKDLRATHLPTLVKPSLHYPKQGSCLEFPGRVCPLFYFDQPQADPVDTFTLAER